MRSTSLIIAALAGLALLVCTGATPPIPDSLGSQSPEVAANPATPGPVLFGIGMHIEPLGATAQMAAATKPTSSSPGAPAKPGQGQAPTVGKVPSPDYNQEGTFDRGVADIEAVAAIVEERGGRMTVQAQSPFTSSAVKYGSSILSDLEESGHEIGLHFHEDAHLGKTADNLSVDQWCKVFKQEIDLIHEAGVDEPVNYWSGGNLYSHLLEAAQCAGLSVNSDWKNPQTQTTEEPLIGSVPWRPAGSSNGTDTSQFAKHDPNGPVVFLPEGNYDKTNFAASRRSDEAGGDEAYFEYLKQSLLRTIEMAQPGRVNVFHFTVHPGEFRGSKDDQFGVIDRFLTEVVDPLVEEGKVQWATFSEMAAAFEAWEKANPGVDPRSTTAAVAANPSSAAGTASNAPSATPSVPSHGGRRGDQPANNGQPGSGVPTTGKIDKDVTYCTGGGQALKMDVYYPGNQSGGTTPAVLYVHGGGWTAGDKRSGAGVETISEMVSRGYLVAAADYRLAPQTKWPAQIEDVKCAVRYLRANAAKYRIDPNKIGVFGGSAGGHLVSMLGVTDGDEGFEGTGGWAGVSSRVQAVVDMFGPADLTVGFEGATDNLLNTVFGASGRTDPIVKNASPVTWVSNDDPPFLILHGDQDALVPLSQSQELYDRLTAAGVAAKLVVVKNAGHSFKPTGGAISPTRGELTKMIGDFFDAKLK